MLESLLIIVTLGAMLFSLGLILIPVVPVSALEWAMAMAYAGLSLALTGSTRLTLPAAALMTALMLIGSTSALWMPLIGLRGKGLSCAGMLAFFVGCVAGSILLPIPILGTALGGIIAVMLVEYARLRELRQAVRSGGDALRVIVYGMAAELFFALCIVGTFITSVLTTPGA